MGVPVCFQTIRSGTELRELRHPRQCGLVFEIHPVAFAFVDLDEMLVPVGIAFLQFVELFANSAQPLVAIRGCACTWFRLVLLTVCAEFGEKLDQLQKADPFGYIHSTKIHEGKPHWMGGEDKDALPWMAKFTRDPMPDRVVWKQTGTPKTRFYWLAVPKDEATVDSLVVATRKGQTIDVTTAEKVKSPANPPRRPHARPRQGGDDKGRRKGTVQRRRQANHRHADPHPRRPR